MSLGFQLGAGFIGFILLGYFIDQKIGKDQIAFTLLGMLLGFIYSIYEVWKLIKNTDNKQ